MIGKSRLRKEDLRFVTGRGRYAADIEAGEALRVEFLRSPVAHGRIVELDADEARQVPGVIAILTGQEAEADGVGRIPTGVTVQNRDGSDMRPAPWPVLPTVKVHYVGQPVAVIVAETQAAAREALDLIMLDIDPLPVAMHGAAEPEIHADVPGNTSFDWQAGDFDAARAAVEAAPHMVEIEYRQNRMAGAPLEGRAGLAEIGPDGESVTLHLATQGANIAHAMIARAALGWPPERLRIVVPDVGGGFGPKFFTYPEQVALTWGAWRLKRSLRWVSERTESFVSESHARDQVVHARLGFDDDGRFLAIALETEADMGAFLSAFAAGNPTDGLAKILTGLYRIPAGGMRARGYFSNTVPVDAYRGAGKPPGVYCLERLADMAAARLGMDRAEIRRRNLLRPDELPHTTPLGKVLDGGSDYAEALDGTLGALDWPGADARKSESRARGRLRGVGLACNLHPIGGSSAETSKVTLSGDGGVVAWTGTQSTGQGHETVYAQILAERLQVPFEQISVRQGDTAELKRGGGTGGSSSTVISGTTLTRAADEAIRIARDRAAEKLEAAPQDLEYAEGVFTIAGTDRSIGIFDLAADEPIRAEHEFADEVAAYPYGVVGAEVEIDPDTGEVRLERLLTTDDAGRIVNPMLLEGQSQGALVQGAGQALMEHLVYDQDGQVLSGSLMDYAMPRALDVPHVAANYVEHLSPTNILGIRGIGELGANGAPAAIANAVFDALAPLGGEATDLGPPFSAHRVWQAIRKMTS